MIVGLMLACTGGPLQSDEPVPDFSLIDLNPASPTSQQPVSPRDLIDQVSGWYFTYAG